MLWIPRAAVSDEPPRKAGWLRWARNVVLAILATLSLAIGLNAEKDVFAVAGDTDGVDGLEEMLQAEKLPKADRVSELIASGSGEPIA